MVVAVAVVVTVLLLQYDEYDNAAHCMMAHSPVAWEHVTFKDVVIKVSNVDVYYKAIRFYLQVSPGVGVEGGRGYRAGQRETAFRARTDRTGGCRGGGAAARMDKSTTTGEGWALWLRACGVVQAA